MNYQHFLGKSKKELDTEPSFTEFSNLKMEQFGADNFLGTENDGVVFSFINGDKLTQIDFYSKGYKGFKQFEKELPKGLHFKMSQKDVQTILGKPEHSQEAREIPVIGLIPAADSFNFGTYRILIRYAKTLDSILLVTLTNEL